MDHATMHINASLSRTEEILERLRSEKNETQPSIFAEDHNFDSLRRFQPFSPSLGFLGDSPYIGSNRAGIASGCHGNSGIGYHGNLQFSYLDSSGRAGCEKSSDELIAKYLKKSPRTATNNENSLVGQVTPRTSALLGNPDLRRYLRPSTSESDMGRLQGNSVKDHIQGMRLRRSGSGGPLRAYDTKTISPMSDQLGIYESKTISPRSDELGIYDTSQMSNCISFNDVHSANLDYSNGGVETASTSHASSRIPLYGIPNSMGDWSNSRLGDQPPNMGISLPQGASHYTGDCATPKVNPKVNPEIDISARVMNSEETTNLNVFQESIHPTQNQNHHTKVSGCENVRPSIGHHRKHRSHNDLQCLVETENASESNNIHPDDPKVTSPSLHHSLPNKDAFRALQKDNTESNQSESIDLTSSASTPKIRPVLRKTSSHADLGVKKVNRSRFHIPSFDEFKKMRKSGEISSDNDSKSSDVEAPKKPANKKSPRKTTSSTDIKVADSNANYEKCNFEKKDDNGMDPISSKLKHDLSDNPTRPVIMRRSSSRGSKLAQKVNRSCSNVSETELLAKCDDKVEQDKVRRSSSDVTDQLKNLEAKMPNREEVRHSRQLSRRHSSSKSESTTPNDTPRESEEDSKSHRRKLERRQSKNRKDKGALESVDSEPTTPTETPCESEEDSKSRRRKLEHRQSKNRKDMGALESVDSEPITPTETPRESEDHSRSHRRKLERRQSKHRALESVDSDLTSSSHVTATDVERSPRKLRSSSRRNSTENINSVESKSPKSSPQTRRHRSKQNSHPVELRESKGQESKVKVDDVDLDERSKKGRSKQRDDLEGSQQGHTENFCNDRLSIKMKSSTLQWEDYDEYSRKIQKMKEDILGPKSNILERFEERQKQYISDSPSKPGVKENKEKVGFAITHL